MAATVTDDPPRPPSLRLLEGLHVVENRGTGIKVMIESMRRANLEPPRFEDRRSSFRVLFQRPLAS